MSNEQYLAASEIYASWGVDTEAALKRLESIPISLHCWQGDDVGGFEQEGGTLSGGGIQATGNYPGKARTLGELRQDLDKALSLIPGKHRLNLHAIYADFGGGRRSRAMSSPPSHFQSWINWCKERSLGLISTRASSRTRWQTMGLLFPAPTRRYAPSGSSTERPAVASPPTWVSKLARPP